MSSTVTRHPLSWYVDKINRWEPFASLLYGDGEFIAMDGKEPGRVMQCGEILDQRLQDELSESMKGHPPGVIRGTDPNLIDWRNYGGTDWPMFHDVGKRVEQTIANINPSAEWVDGVVWEDAVSKGELGPLIKAIRQREVVLVGHDYLYTSSLKGERYSPWAFLKAKRFIRVPSKNAWAATDKIEKGCRGMDHNHLLPVFIVCCGLGAIPLIMRLRKHFPHATFLDLGSIFDCFVGLGSQRGWRNDLYRDVKKWKALLDKNLEGIG